MIILTKLNDVPFVVNCDLIETIFQNPDTTVKLTNGSIYIVKEKMEHVVEKVIDYKKQCISGLVEGDKIFS